MRPSGLETAGRRFTEAELDELTVLRMAVLREAERYRVLFESAPLAFITTNDDGNIVEANAVAGEYLARDIRFLVGKPLLSYVVAGERRRVRSWMRELVRRGARGELTARMQRRTGVTFDAHVSVTPSADEVLWAILDVTDQRQAEDHTWALNRELDSRVAAEVGELQAVYDELPIGIAIVDAATGRVHGKNRRAQEILRPWDGELPTLDRFDIDGRAVPPERWQLARALAGQHVSREVNRVRTPAGEDVVLDLGAAPLRDADGSVVAVALTFHDLSERERRERADAQFVENAAHQLRTPITAIAIATAALEAGAKDDPDERERFIAHIARESDRMAQLVDALLALARLQRSGARPLVALVPIAALVSDIVAGTNLRRGVELVVDCPAEVAVVGEDAMLREAIANVIRNAAAHTAAGSIRVSARLEDENAIIEVADSGPGVPVEVRERVFERFFQVGRDSPKGAGLGLAIAWEAARANGGRLELVDSSPGATFRFTLPGARLL